VTPIGQLTARDLDVLGALDRAPHTADQLLRLSKAFVRPFPAERLVRRRLQQLAAGGFVRRAPLSGLAGRGGCPNGYLLTPLGHRVLRGPDAPPPSKRFGTPPAVSRHRHTHALSEFLVHLHVAAHAAGVAVTGFCRENSVLLADGPDGTYPDAAFQLVAPGGKALSYFVELDAGTERIRNPKEDDSWERKLRIYEAVRGRAAAFRVLVVTLSSDARAAHVLDLAQAKAANPRRRLVYAGTLSAFLDAATALTAPVFRDHLGCPVSILPTHVVDATRSALC